MQGRSPATLEDIYRADIVRALEYVLGHVEAPSRLSQTRTSVRTVRMQATAKAVDAAIAALYLYIFYEAGTHLPAGGATCLTSCTARGLPHADLPSRAARRPALLRLSTAHGASEAHLGRCAAAAQANAVARAAYATHKSSVSCACWPIALQALLRRYLLRHEHLRIAAQVNALRASNAHIGRLAASLLPGWPT